MLFSGTLYDNLAMAHQHASFEDVIRACKAAGIHEVIEQLPDGYPPRKLPATYLRVATSA